MKNITPGLYRTKGGNIIKVYEITASDDYPVVGVISDCLEGWRKDGRYCSEKTSDRDLVERIGDLPGSQPEQSSGQPTKTLRDEFAMAALSGMLASQGGEQPGHYYYDEKRGSYYVERDDNFAAKTFVYADAMLKEREK